MPKDKLKPKFDPIWQSDFVDFRLKKMSRTAFIMRQMYRLYRNPETNSCVLSDLQIRNITGWDLHAIRKARQQLIFLQEITPTGYHSFTVKTFHQFEKTLGETPKPQNKQFMGNPETSLGETPKQFRDNPETSLGETPKPYNTDLKIQNKQNNKFNQSSVEKPVNKYCGDCNNFNPEYLDVKGNKVNYCAILLCSIPPYTDASSCDKFLPKESEVTNEC